MSKKFSTKLIGLLAATALVAAACSSDDDTSSDDTQPADTTQATDAADDMDESEDTDAAAVENTDATEDTDDADDMDESEDTDAAEDTDDSALAAELLWDNGDCDTSLTPYGINITAPFEAPNPSPNDQVSAMEVSVDIFNARGGIGGHCMALTTCDDGGDPNVSLDCAREAVDDATIMAVLNDTPAFNPQGWVDVTLPADLARFGLSPGQETMAAEVTDSYPFSGGGTGTTFVMSAACTKHGFKKIGMINVDTPTIDRLISVVEGMVGAYDAEFVGNITVPAGTTDFQQFIITMEDLGAECVMMPLGENEALQVLQAADQLDTDMWFSTSSGSTGLDGIKALSSVQEQILLNGALPAATGSTERWPALQLIVDDLSSTGDPQLQYGTLKESPMRSWVAVYAFVRTIEDFGDPDDVSRDAVNAAIRAATDIDMLGLTPKWTPNTPSSEIESFGRISNPWFFVWTYDAAIENFVVDEDQIDMISEVLGQIDYPQPA